jgi:hypothetical protein
MAGKRTGNDSGIIGSLTLETPSGFKFSLSIYHTLITIFTVNTIFKVNRVIKSRHQFRLRHLVGFSSNVGRVRSLMSWLALD